MFDINLNSGTTGFDVNLSGGSFVNFGKIKVSGTFQDIL